MDKLNRWIYNHTLTHMDQEKAISCQVLIIDHYG